LQFAPSTYYAYKTRGPSARCIRDKELKVEIMRVYKANREVYGARKIHRQLVREGIEVGLDRVERLMKELGIEGVVRGGGKIRTTKADPKNPLPSDLLDRNFTATEPNQKWVADFTYVATLAGMVYVAFVIDLFSRMIVGWSVSKSMTTEFVLDALEMAIWSRDGDLSGLIHHSDRGSQYTAIAYGEHLSEADILASVGSKGDSYDNAVAESTIGLYKTELTKRRGPWRNAIHLELETLDHVEWFNTQRLHGACGDVPPVEFEQHYARKAS
jgi:putative transposase